MNSTYGDKCRVPALTEWTIQTMENSYGKFNVQLGLSNGRHETLTWSAFRMIKEMDIYYLWKGTYSNNKKLLKMEKCMITASQINQPSELECFKERCLHNFWWGAQVKHLPESILNIHLLPLQEAKITTQMRHHNSWKILRINFIV